ncbi:MAG: hypothetical protein ACE5GC_04485 [Acidimicrobiia bacterium]
MLWYNNPEAVQAIHEGVRERHVDMARRRRLLRLVASVDHSEA